MTFLRLAIITSMSLVFVTQIDFIVQRFISELLAQILNTHDIQLIDNSRVNATFQNSKIEPQTVGVIPLVRPAPVDLQDTLPKDFLATRQTPRRTGKREILLVSSSTKIEQRYLMNLPRDGGFELYEVEFRKVSGVNGSQLLGNSSQINATQAQSLVNTFKITFKSNSLSEVILADGSKAEFSANKAIIKNSNGQVIETIQLSIATRQNAPSNLYLTNSKSLNKPARELRNNVSSVQLAQGASCQDTARSTMNNSTTLMATWVEQFSQSKDARTKVVRWALAYGTEAIKSNTIPKEDSLQDMACRQPVRCGERRIAGASEVRTDLFEVPPGARAGDIKLKYEFFTIPDRIEMYYEQGDKPFFQLPPTSGQGSVSVPEPPKGAEYVGVTIRGNPDPDTRWWYEVSCSVQPYQLEITGIDRWWATVGDKPIDVTLNVNVPKGRYGITVDFGLVNHWKLKNSQATIDGKPFSQELNPFPDLGIIDLGELEAGKHQIKISGFQIPNNPFVEEITFHLSGKNESGKKVSDKLVALFIADRPEVTRSEYLVQGSPRPLKGVQELVDYFAPVLYFEKEDSVQFPYDAATTFNSQSKKSDLENRRSEEKQSRPVREGDRKTYICLGIKRRSDCSPFTFGKNKNFGKVYASVLEKPQTQDELAINYYFFYPISDWGDKQNCTPKCNTHEGDWEGITLFLKKNGNQWTLDRAAYAQHTDPPKRIKLDELRFFNGSSHPEVYVGLGGHASYPNPDTYDGRGTLWRVEKHRGQKTPWLAQGRVEYLPRVGYLNANHWLLFSGRWGDPELGGLGSSAPHGPLFLEVSLTGRGDSNVGRRWLNPWDWE